MTVEPYDEEEISAADLIIRRVPEHQIVWDENGEAPRRRISTGLYSKSSGPKEGMSVVVEALIQKDELNPREYVITPDFQGAVSFTAESIRALDLMVGYHPIEDVPNVPDNPYHGEVWRKEEARKFTGTQEKGLRTAAQWYVKIEGVDLK